jgi:hypothetical protein
MNLDDCKKAYRNLAKNIFQKSWSHYVGWTTIGPFLGWAPYSGTPLKREVQTLLDERLSIAEKEMLGNDRRSPGSAPLGTVIGDNRCKT